MTRTGLLKSSVLFFMFLSLKGNCIKFGEYVSHINSSQNTIYINPDSSFYAIFVYGEFHRYSAGTWNYSKYTKNISLTSKCQKYDSTNALYRAPCIELGEMYLKVKHPNKLCPINSNLLGEKCFKRRLTLFKPFIEPIVPRSPVEPSPVKPSLSK